MLFTANQFGLGLNIIDKRDLAILKQFDSSLVGTTGNVQALIKENQLASAAFNSLSPAAKQAATQLDGTGVSAKKLGLSFNVAAIGAQLLNVALNMAIFAAVSYAIQAVVKGIQDYINRVQIAKDKTNDAVSAWEDTISELSSVEEKLRAVNERLDELYGLVGTSSWNDTLQDELSKLQSQNSELETKITLLKQEQELKRQAARDALLEEIETSSGTKYTSPYSGKAKADNLTDYVLLLLRQLTGNANSAGYTLVSEDEVIEEDIRWLEEINAKKQQGIELTEDEEKKYQAVLETLNAIGLQYSDWATKGGLLGFPEDQVAQWQATAERIADTIAQSGYQQAQPLSIKDRLENQLRYDRRADDLRQALGNWDGGTSKGFLDEANQTSDAYKTAKKYADIYGVSVEYLVAQLEKLGYFTAATTDETTDFLKAAQDANNELEAFAESYDVVNKAVEEYNDNGYVTDDTLSSLEQKIPGVISLLYDESGQLRDGAAAAFESTDAMLAFLQAQVQAQIVAAQTDYSRLVQELGKASAAAIAAQQNIENLQALLDLITGARGAGDKQKKSSGGGSSSIYSKEYKNAKDYTEHMIKLSELRQERMEEESEEYEQESQKQILYYQQLVDATVAEMQRLAAEGYDITNEQYRKLLEDFESYQNAIYQIAYAAWKQQQSAAKEAIQDQIDAENERWEARKKQLDFERDAQQARLDLENEYLDVIGEITDEISELDRQLATALSYPIGSDLNLFTQEEHDNLVSQLEDISDEAASLYEEYQARISDATVDTEWELQSITDEFERQYELLLKQYEISKADLAVARARRDLENVLNERNVAMLVNGVWTWVADSESVKAAVEAVYDAEKDAEDALTDLINTQRTQAIEEAISNIEAQTAVEEAAHDKIIEGLEDQLEAIDEMDFVFDDFIATFMSGTEALKAAIANLNNIPQKEEPPDNPQSPYTPTGVDKAGNPKPGNSGPTPTAYADGGVADYTGLAKMDATRSKAEVVFNSANAKKLYDLIFNTDDLVAMMAGRIGNAMMNINPSFGGTYGATSGASTVTNVYIDGVQIGGQDGETILSLLRRNVPLVKNRG